MEKRKIIFVGIALLTTLIAAAAIMRSAKDIDGVSNSALMNQASNVASKSSNNSDSKNSIDIDLVNLDSVNERLGTAVTTRYFSQGIFTHTVNAQVSDPSDGKFYEGWLVVPGASPRNFFSTGAMTKNDLGEWELVYTAEQDYPEHSFVVITEETSSAGFDNNPETHIFEGAFE